MRPAQWTFLVLCGGTFPALLASACGLNSGGLGVMEAGVSVGDESLPDRVADNSPFSDTDRSAHPDAVVSDTSVDVMHDAAGLFDAGPKADALPEAMVPEAADDAAVDAAADSATSGDVANGYVDSTDESVEASDGATCDFTGTWATRIVIDVNWVPQGIMGVILAPGSGQITQWLLSKRTVSGSDTTDTASVCGIALPDFSGTAIAGGEKYGIQFPDALFDSGDLQTFTLNGTLSGSGPGATFSTSPTAVLLGLTLSSPTTAPWPANITTSVDSDMDGKPGVTAWVSQDADAGYSEIQVDPFGGRGDRVYLAIRQVTSISGNALDCDAFGGLVNIPQIADPTGMAKYAIDSHVLGCRLINDAGDCSAGQTTFVDTTQPVFSPSGATTFASVRVADDATCMTARQRLP